MIAVYRTYVTFNVTYQDPFRNLNNKYNLKFSFIIFFITIRDESMTTQKSEIISGFNYQMKFSVSNK